MLLLRLGVPAFLLKDTLDLSAHLVHDVVPGVELGDCCFVEHAGCLLFARFPEYLLDSSVQCCNIASPASAKVEMRAL